MCVVPVKKPLLTQEMKKRRLQFAKGKKDWDMKQWNKVNK